MKEKYIPPVVTKTNFLNHPILDYAKDIKDYHVSPKLETQHAKKFDRMHMPVHQYEPKSFRLKKITIGDDYDIDGFEKGKFKGLKEFYGYLGIKDRKIPNAPNPNYYEFGLKKENDGVFLVKNWRKQLGTQDVGSTKQDFMQSYKKLLEDLEGGKKEKIKSDDFVDVEIGSSHSKKEKVIIEPVVKEVLDEIVDKIEKPKKAKKQKKDDDSEKIVQDLLNDILKDVDEMQRKQEEKEAKRKSKRETREMQTQTDSSSKQTKDIEIQTSHDDIDKEGKKQEIKELLENTLENKLEKEGKPKEKRLTSLEIEDNFETFLGSHFENVKGRIGKEAKLKDLAQLTNYINTINENKKRNENLKGESETLFKEKVLPILESLDITENDLLIKFLNKKISKKFTHSNLETIKKGIVKFQKSYRMEFNKPNIIESDEEK